MMAKQTYPYILGYVITIILILSNVKIVSSNEKNQYATTTTAAAATTTSTATAFPNAALEVTDVSVAISSTQRFHAATTSTAHVYPMSKMTLHNTSSTTLDEEPSKPNDQKEVHKQVDRPTNSGKNSSNRMRINNNSNSNSNVEQQRQNDYLVQQDAENPKQLLSSIHSLSLQDAVDVQANLSEKNHNHAQVIIQQRNDVQSTTPPLIYHDQFMNEYKKTPSNAIESSTASSAEVLPAKAKTNIEMRYVQPNEHNEPLEHNNGASISHGSSSGRTVSGNRRSEIGTNDDNNNDDSRKSDEITSMPMKIVRDNVNVASDAVSRLNSEESDGATKVNKTFAFDNSKLLSTDNNNNNNKYQRREHRDDGIDDDDSFSLEESSHLKFNERSRYLETDLDEFDNDEPEQSDVNVNDQLEWPSDKFEELTLDDIDDMNKKSTNIHARSWTKDDSMDSLQESITPRTATAQQNILKISKSNKSKSIKRLAVGSATVSDAAPPPQLPQALLEIRLNKSPPMSPPNEKQFIKSQSFRFITNLYDQYEWDADELRKVLSPRCASDMYVYLDALIKGKIWAAKASDASGRYRGQFMFDNNHWLGSILECDGLAKIDEMEVSFFVATTLVASPEPLIEKHILRVGQCLPAICTTEDVRSILDADPWARKFMDNFVNATTEQGRADISVLGVRRVPGDYSAWKDRQFYMVIFICITFVGLTVWATIYEISLSNMRREMDDENVLPSRQAIHPIHITKAPKTNGQQQQQQRIYSYENATIGLENTEPTLKIDKIHTNNIINGCTLELHPISIEHNNGNHLANNNRTALYRLNTQYNNNNANNINNNHHAGNNDDANDSNHLKRGLKHSRNGSTTTTYTTKTMRTHEQNHLSIPQQLLLSFALPTNIKTILSTKKLPQDSIGCIHGLRVFSMMWTILVHTYLQLYAVSENRYTKILQEKTFWFQILGNASYTVDTFFFISGFLVTLLFLRTKTTTKTSSEGHFISFVAEAKQSFLLVLYRYIRLTPVYFMVIIINAVTLKYVYNKAVFTPGLPDHITCPNYWWRNILYIQTWFPFTQLCMLWAWYLADDMQFYIWAIVILILSRRYGRTAVALIVTFLLASWVVSALVSLHFNYTHKVAEPLESFGYLYEKPWTRLGPYVMGMIAGYILNRYKSAPPAITPFINIVLWTMSLSVMLLLVFGVWNGTLNLLWTALYVSLGHSAWGMALIWIVLSCKWGLGKPIDSLLSLRALLPLSRLTYCAYLVHPVTQISVSLDLKGPIHIDHAIVFTIFLGNVVIAYWVALILALLFEAPIVRLLKILFSKQQ
ncbi:uncharacterized protein LOC116346685 [Contarinia nasturtii]|uniref:uncharacterized protein LOC116346685 n=1 Tax=Contarinia nasturtii TaxID=265458 RepID=UPI0012D4B312|nr:uncharacterized protein LOC116346685 [Contarinia nasturtii]XP_031632726.1 uncharacterized protein LOC116346685 [Contarinia nasturtii]XP_031632727.1 uncharacterized protein LOC116346685 [Contarinia nasturtii]XP_031632729.1 uncharacterized protein LOC116346685 [Contarinia nasturtii]XP_031632730.1 uncharacterized protein LOC116346685 [Contarinia nasturtii]XP_031632731.1 uncharacterized protein LOC116346685 [Contarinia nasturtii]